MAGELIHIFGETRLQAERRALPLREICALIGLKQAFPQGYIV
jgi:hypothetical protein